MIRKSLIWFWSGTSGGRVDVVVRMIGCIFVNMWAFWGKLVPPSLGFFLLCCCLCCLLVACYVIGSCSCCCLTCVINFFLHCRRISWLSLLTLSAGNLWQEDKKKKIKKKKVKFEPTLMNKKEANDSLPKGNLASIWRPPLGVSEARFYTIPLSNLNHQLLKLTCWDTI